MKRIRGFKKQCGMSLIELMLAMTMLAVGLAGVLVLITTAIASNNRNKLDTGGTLVAQMVIETIAAQAGTNNVTLHDCDASVTGGHAWTVATIGGAGAGTSAGAELTADKKIDYTKAVVTNYQMNYISCGSAGRQVTYDVRWNIYTINNFTRMITVSARQLGAPATAAGTSLRYFAPPVTLRTIAVTGN